MPEADQQYGAYHGTVAIGPGAVGLRTMHGCLERDPDASDRGGRTGRTGLAACTAQAIRFSGTDLQQALFRFRPGCAAACNKVSTGGLGEQERIEGHAGA